MVRYTLLYSALFLAFSLINRYDCWLNLPPASIHQWRQADGAAIAWNYSRNPDFQEVRINNLFSAGDSHALGEWTGLYWLAGCIGRIPGAPDYPLRWIGWLLLYTGGWAFGWMILQGTRKPLLASTGALLLLSAPVLGYYGPSSLPDAPAFCFVLIMIACMLRAQQLQSPVWLGAATLAAILAISLKISCAILPLALMATWWHGKRLRHWKGFPLWNGYWPVLAQILLASTILLLRLWIYRYNNEHHADYFLSATRPIWQYDGSFILETLVLATRNVAPYFASVGLYASMFVGAWYYVRTWKKLSFLWKSLPVWSLVGSLGYFLLWFRMFREHDYYALCLLVLPALLLLFVLTKWSQKNVASKLNAALWIFCILGMLHSHAVLSNRLHTTGRNYLPADAFLDEHAYLASGIPDTARWLCPEDPSPNTSLLALRGFGWTAYNFGHQVAADTIQYYQQQHHLSHLALRDSTLYDPVYQSFFPRPLKGLNGWYFYEK